MIASPTITNNTRQQRQGLDVALGRRRRCAARTHTHGQKTGKNRFATARKLKAIISSPRNERESNSKVKPMFRFHTTTWPGKMRGAPGFPSLGVLGGGSPPRIKRSVWAKGAAAPHIIFANAFLEFVRFEHVWSAGLYCWVGGLGP